MTTAWAHLPNARYIDRVLADVDQRPEVWSAAWLAARAAARAAAQGAARDAAPALMAWVAARDAAIDAGRGVVGDAAMDAATDAAMDAAIDAAMDAVVALTGWDDSGALLDMPASTVERLAASGNQAALLLLPAVIAFDSGDSQTIPLPW